MTDPALLATPDDYGLLTDLYQFTMASCYVGEGIADRWASFELFTRRQPQGYGYLVAMGLAQAIEYLTQLRFSAAHLAALRQTGLFDQAPDGFWQRLESGGFTGQLWAVPEGTAVFANEPLLRVEAPLWQAQLVETYLLNTLNYQTLIATRAARLRDLVGPGITLLEFGARRALCFAHVWIVLVVSLVIVFVVATVFIAAVVLACLLVTLFVFGLSCILFLFLYSRFLSSVHARIRTLVFIPPYRHPHPQPHPH